MYKETLAQQESLIAQLRETAAGESTPSEPLPSESLPTESCEAVQETEEFQSLLVDFEAAQNEKLACDANIADTNNQIAELRDALALAQSEQIAQNNNTEDADALERIQTELLALQDENARLVAAEENQAQVNREQVARLEEKLVKANEDNELMLSRIDAFQEQIESFAQAESDDDMIQALQTELAQLGEENTRLQSLIDEAAALAEQEAQEEAEQTFTSGDLQLTKFDTQVNYCDSEVAQGNVCIDNISSTANFNFNPNSFISLRLIDPNGDTVQRQSVAGRTITNIEFDLDAGTEMPAGEYTVEFKINDVFNKFDARKTFSLAQQ